VHAAVDPESLDGKGMNHDTSTDIGAKFSRKQFGLGLLASGLGATLPASPGLAAAPAGEGTTSVATASRCILSGAPDGRKREPPCHFKSRLSSGSRRSILDTRTFVAG